MLIAGWVFCALLLGMTLLLGRERKYGGVLLLQLAIFLAPMFLMVVLVSLFWLTIALGVLAVVAISIDLRPVMFRRWAVGVTGAILLLTTAFGWLDFQDTIERRERLAFEPIEQRLTPLQVVAGETNHSRLPGLTLDRLETQESDLEYEFYQSGLRSDAIQRLHEHTVQQFINSPGFGVTRMSGWDRRLLETDDPGLIPQPEMMEPPYVPDDAELPGKLADLQPPSDELLQQLHFDGLVDFINPEGFGYRNSQGLVAGFESHRFSRMPGSTQEMGSWRLARVELVSLLKSSEPRVYESEHLPRMDELNSTSTRSARPFEMSAIDRLRAGEDLVTRSQGGRYYLVGSLRAMTQCVECHSRSRGDLLGAFSYEFRTTHPLPKSIDPGA